MNIIKTILKLFLITFVISSIWCTNLVAGNFDVNRRITLYNTITDTYVLSIKGRCYTERFIGMLKVKCKISDNIYKTHYLILSDNVSFILEQIDNTNKYEVSYKPQVIE